MTESAPAGREREEVHLTMATTPDERDPGEDRRSSGPSSFPYLRQVVLDTTDARVLAEFYRQLLGYTYQPGDEPPLSGDDARGKDWLVLLDAAGRRAVAIQHVERLAPSTWPDDAVPQQLHLDLTVPSTLELDRQHERVLALGGRLLHDASDDPDEPIRVYADPSGHPFCVFVAT